MFWEKENLCIYKFINIFSQLFNHSQLLNIIILKFNSSVLLNLMGNMFLYCPADEAIRRINSSSIDHQERSMLDW